MGKGCTSVQSVRERDGNAAGNCSVVTKEMKWWRSVRLEVIQEGVVEIKRVARGWG
jgi:hypothetical protein